MTSQEIVIEVGKHYRTPWEPSGVVEVVAIEESYGSALIRFVGRHPKGYADGSIGRYPLNELRELESRP